jgi:hypothetical protein
VASKLPETYTGPAFVDLQVNGYAGFDFNGDPDTWTPEAFQHVREAMRNRGTFRALPTFITDYPALFLVPSPTYISEPTRIRLTLYVVLCLTNANFI